MSKRILIIEDEESIAKTFKKKLERFGGYKVDIAGGGKKGLEMIEGNEYGIVLLDLVMPEFDGMAVLEAVNKDKGKYHNSPIAVLTNLDTDEEKTRAEKLGAVGFFSKVDISTEDLITAVKKYASS